MPQAWRLSYFVPLALHIIGGLMVLTARDLPDGNYKELENIGAKQTSNSSVVLKVGCSNINALIFTLTYGACFGIELTMNNVANRYFYKYHGLDPQISGLCAAAWGLMNIICRSMGGWLSDWSNAKAGMRGRCAPPTSQLTQHRGSPAGAAAHHPTRCCLADSSRAPVRVCTHAACGRVGSFRPSRASSASSSA